MIARARRAQNNGLLDVLDFVVHQNDIGLFQSCMGAACAHFNRDICSC